MMEAATLRETIARSDCDEPLDSQTIIHIRLHLDYLMNHLVVGPLLQTLCQKNLISTRIKAEIKAKATSAEQAEALIDHINKGSQALFAALLEVLETDKQYEVLRVLMTRHKDEGAVVKKQYPLLSNLKNNEATVIASVRFEGSFLLNLVTKEAITENQKEYLQSIPSRRNRAEALVLVLQTGGNDDRMKKFIDVLGETDQNHLSSLIARQDEAGVLSQKERDEMLPNMMTFIDKLKEFGVVDKVPALVQLDIITEAQKEEILHKATPTERAEFLLDVIKCRPLTALKKLQEHIKAETTKEGGRPHAEKYQEELRQFQKHKSHANQQIGREFGFSVGSAVFFIALLLVPKNALLHGQEEIKRGFEQQHDMYVDTSSLFDTDSNGCYPRRILVLGVAGSGKSSLANYSCEQWGLGRLWTQFKYVFNLTCRRLNTMVESKTTINLLDILLKLGPTIAEGDKAIMREELASNQQHILIVVDGIDELSGWIEFDPDKTLPCHDINEPAGILELINSVMVGDLMGESSVLITSRPIDKIDSDQFDQTVKIFGFGRESIEKCILALANGNEDKQRDVLKYLDHRPQLYLFCTLPLGCIMTGRVVLDVLAHMSKDDQQHETINCATVLYIYVLLVFLNRRGQQTKNIKDRFEGVYVWCDSLWKMMKLAAWGMMQSSSIIFSALTLKEHTIDEDDLPCGLLDMTTVDTQLSMGHSGTSAAFIHYSLQEFLTALYIAITWNSADIKLITSRKASHTFNMVLLFLSGLLGNPLGRQLIQAIDNDITSKTLDRRFTKLFNLLVVEYEGRFRFLPNLSQTSKDSCKLGRLQLLRCVAESNHRDLVQNMEGLVVKGGILDLTDMPGGLLPEHLPAIAFFIQWSTAAKALRLEPLYCCSLVKMKTPETERRLVAMIDTALLQAGELGLSDTPLSEDDVGGLAVYLSLSQGITDLSLTGNQIRSHGVESIAAALKVNRTLTTLGLCRNQITAQGIESIVAALHVNGTLTDLYLYGNDISDVGAESLATALRNNNTLNTLDLHGNKITDVGADHLASALRDNLSLTQLWLWENQLSAGKLEEMKEEFGDRVHFKPFK